MNDKYGVPRDIYARVKLIGLFIYDLVLIGGSAVLAFSLAPKVFPPSMWLQMFAFILLTPIFMLYLLLPTNGGKKNWQTLYLFFRRKRKRYISINYLGGDKRWR